MTTPCSAAIFRRARSCFASTLDGVTGPCCGWTIGCRQRTLD
jgi:hypothetical protein